MLVYIHSPLLKIILREIKKTLSIKISVSLIRLPIGCRNCHVVTELACPVHNGVEQYQLLVGFRTDTAIPFLKWEYTSPDVSH